MIKALMENFDIEAAESHDGYPRIQITATLVLAKLGGIAHMDNAAISDAIVDAVERHVRSCAEVVEVKAQ